MAISYVYIQQADVYEKKTQRIRPHLNKFCYWEPLSTKHLDNS